MKKLILYILFGMAIDAMAIVFLVDTLHMPRAAYQMPRIFIALILLLSVLMIVEQAVLMRKKPNGNGNDGAGAGGSELSGANGIAASPEISVPRIAVFVLLILGYILTIKPLGYFIATPAFLVGTLAFLKSTKLSWIAAIAVGFTAFVYLLFVLFLHMPVPMGLLD